MRLAFGVAMLGCLVAVLGGPQSAYTQGPAGSLLARHYVENERLSYRLTATERNRTATTSNAATARGVVTRDQSGRFVEEFQWGDVVQNGVPFAIPAANQGFRQLISLDPEVTPKLPDFSAIHPRLIGPSSDFMNFYADVWLAMRQAGLRQAGDRVTVAHGGPNSWADGTRVILGEDAIDFILSLESLDRARNTATLVINHVPPDRAYVRTPAEWMRTPLSNRPNNWVKVLKMTPARYIASVGVETFVVRVVLTLTTGKILSVTMDNPVQVLERECSDAMLAMCGEPVRYQIVRRVEMTEAP